MTHDLLKYSDYEVFLNHPYDVAFRPYADAIAFAVVASPLIPVAASDLSRPDQPRLQTIVAAIGTCKYSIHDLSRSAGEGDANLARMNMPLEMGMALFHALHTQYRDHSCAFLVPTAHHYMRFASDLAGLDPIVYGEDEPTLVGEIFDWLRDIVPNPFRSDEPTSTIIEGYAEYREHCTRYIGSDVAGALTNAEAREVMYKTASERGWWDWRSYKAGALDFPVLPLSPAA